MSWRHEAMGTMTFDDYLALTQLYADYAIAVDSGQWDLWPEFFTDECVYRLQPRENFERGFPLATLSFTSKGMLKDRVYGIRETLFHDPYYQRHVVGSPVVRKADGERFECEANYAVFRTKLSDTSGFATASSTATRSSARCTRASSTCATAGRPASRPPSLCAATP